MNSKRDKLIEQAKNAYGHMANWATQDHVVASSAGFGSGESQHQNPEQYYEIALESAIEQIQSGKFDNSPSDFNIVEYLANQKSKATRIHDSIQNTKYNMEFSSELMALADDPHRLRELKARNDARQEALQSFERDLKEAEAAEQLQFDLK